MNENTNNDKQDKKKEGSTLPTTTIDLDALDSTEALSEDKLIFYDECQRMAEKIRQKAMHNIGKGHRDTNDKSNVDTKNAPSCFFIDGPRGSGKSTLLRAIRDAVASDKLNTNKNPNVQIFPLADVDPTELGKGENFFVYLLGKVYSQLQDKIKQSNGRDALLDKIRTALNTIRDMSGGLQMLMDSEEVLKKNGTPEFFMENCLDKCSDSTKMREKFSSLIDTLADILNTDVFLVTIDDADLNFSKCEDVLEYIRKYMHSPRLIFLFAGDMQLYSHIVRGMQLQNFHEKQLKHDYQHKKNREQLLGSIEDQYLLKIFPVDNRIHTKSLKTIIDEGQHITISISKSNGDERTKGIDIKGALAKYLKTNVEDASIDTILYLPLRSVLQLLRHLVKNPYQNDTHEAAQYRWKGFQDVFLQTLIEYNVNYTQIGTNDIRILQKTVLEYYARTGLWHADLSLQANEGETKARQVALYLAETVNLSTTSLSSKIKYWCACFPLWQRIREERLSSGNDIGTRDLLESSLKQSNEQYGSPWANLACAAMAPNIKEEFLFGRGTICILNENCEQNNEIGQDARIGFHALAEAIKKKTNNRTQEEMQAHAALSASFCRIDDSKSSYFYLSVYHLMMYIAEWLDLGQKILINRDQSNQRDDEENASEELKNAIWEKLSKPLVASETQRISKVLPKGTGASPQNERHSESTVVNGEYFSSISHNAFEYSWQPRSGTIADIYQWIEKYVSLSYISSPVDYYLAWEGFKSKCIELTYGHVSEYRQGKTSPDCASIFSAYLNAIEHAMAFLCDQRQTAHGQTKPKTENTIPTIQSCIREFPLWKSLKDFMGSKRNYLKQVRIGYFVNVKRKQKFHEYKIAYQSPLSKISALEKELKATQLKLIAAQQGLNEARIKQKEKEIKFKRIQEAIFETSQKRDELAKMNKGLFESEQALKQSIKQLQMDERSIIGLIDEIEEQSRRIKAKVDVSQKRANIKEPMPAHLRAWLVINMAMGKYQLTGSNKPSTKAISESSLNIKELGKDLISVRDRISNETIHYQSLIRDRVKTDNELLEQKKKLDELLQLEFSASVDLQNARVKCETAQTSVNEAQAHLETAVNDLEKAKKTCKQAEEIYKNYKISNRDE